MNVRLETKVRVLAVFHILIRRAATVKEIQEELAVRYGIQEELAVRYGIQAKRQTIYNDIMAINELHPVAYDGYNSGWRYSIKKGGKK